MSPATTEVKRAASGGLTAGNVDLSAEYRSSSNASRASLLEQAAVVLLVFQHRLTPTERMGFTALFARRLRRAYGGPRHG